MDLGGWAALAGGIALLIGASAGAYATVVSANKIKVIAPVIEETAKKVVEIDKAVNGKEPGAQSMVSQVDDLHKEIPIPEIVGVNGDALLPLVRLLVADMQERREASLKHQSS